MSKTKTTKEYFEEWHPYDLLIRHNYMRHQEMIACLGEQWLATVGQASSLLEIGCGNAYAAVEALADQSEIRYTGIDLSAYALQGAAQNLDKTDWSVKLIEGDAVACIQNLNQPYDCVVSGFSLHHFSPSDTLLLLKEMRRLIKPGGLTVVYDIVTKEGESREGFLERLIAGIDTDAIGMSASQMETMSQHIRQYDFPVSLPTWNQLAEEAGFSSVSCKYRDEEAYYGFLILN